MADVTAADTPSMHASNPGDALGRETARNQCTPRSCTWAGTESQGLWLPTTRWQGCVLSRPRNFSPWTGRPM